MESTAEIPLADFTRHHDSHDLPDPVHRQSHNSILTKYIPSDTRDTEEAWHSEQQMPADTGERELVNLPRADGGKDAWLFLCGCFTIEALVWGRLSPKLVSYTLISFSDQQIRDIMKRISFPTSCSSFPYFHFLFPNWLECDEFIPSNYSLLWVML
jgi:hypothetical protein